MRLRRASVTDSGDDRRAKGVDLAATPSHGCGLHRPRGCLQRLTLSRLELLPCCQPQAKGEWLSWLQHPILMSFNKHQLATPFRHL